MRPATAARWLLFPETPRGSRKLFVVGIVWFFSMIFLNRPDGSA